MSEQSSVVVFGRAGEVVPSCPSCARLRAEAEQIRAEIEEMRLSAKKMHRRCQAAEKIADAKIEKWEDQKRSLGRALANSACAVLMAQRDEARAENEALRAKYDELLLAVGIKYEGETRHETALRYIRQQEDTPSTGPWEAKDA